MSVASFREMTRHIREMAGGPVGDVLIHQLGISNGKGIAQSIESVFGTRPSREELEEFLHLIRAAGWGVETLKEIDYEASTAKVQVANCTECSFYDKSSKPQSQFVRGSYEAQFGHLFGKTVDTEEVLCIAKGDAVCEFTVGPRHGQSERR
jgi:predicted hydrocarbon binding protein